MCGPFFVGSTLRKRMLTLGDKIRLWELGMRVERILFWSTLHKLVWSRLPTNRRLSTHHFTAVSGAY